MTEPEPEPAEQLGPGAEWEGVLIAANDPDAVMTSGVETFDTAELLGGTTPAMKLPYPESSDPLNQGANNIKALALAMDGVWTAGTGSPVSDSGGRVSFPHGLGKTPRVVVVGQKMITPDGDNAIDAVSRVMFSKADATNITCRFYDLRTSTPFGGNPVGIAWLAIA
jgi:hypothetical protein